MVEVGKGTYYLMDFFGDGSSVVIESRGVWFVVLTRCGGAVYTETSND